MRICDICARVTQRLETLPKELGHMEVCDPCRRRLLDLFDACEREVASLRTGLMRAAVEKWKLERSPAGKEAGPP